MKNNKQAITVDINPDHIESQIISSVRSDMNNRLSHKYGLDGPVWGSHSQLVKDIFSDAIKEFLANNKEEIINKVVTNLTNRVSKTKDFKEATDE